VVIAAFITPRENLRSLVREIVGRDHLDLIWVDTPLAICQQRDPKGLYRQSAAGKLPLFTGMNSVFEESTAHDCGCSQTCVGCGIGRRVGRLLPSALALINC